MKKRISHFILAVILLCQNLVTETFASSLWSVTINNVLVMEELETTDNVALYSGGSQAVEYHNEPSERDFQFLILEITVEKENSAVELFQIQQISLELSGEVYEQLEQGFLEDHGYTAFPNSQLRFGSRTGHIVFEIPQSAELDQGFLLFEQEEISLKAYTTEKNSQWGTMNVIENLLDKQWQLEKEILQDYENGDYTIKNPYIAMDPYQWSELTALVLFHTEENAKVSVTVEGKDDYSHVSHDFQEYGKFQQIPILGLYEDYLNTVEITLTYEDGSKELHQLEIQTAPLLEDSSLVELDVRDSQPSDMAEGFTFLTTTSKKPIVVDSNGDIRWILDYPIYHIFQRIENGNMLLKKSDGSGFYEMDLLGKIYNQYQDVNNIHHDVIELPNGNFLTTSSHKDTVEDRLIELDRDTGKVVWDFDLSNVFQTDRYLEEGYYDWFHLNSMAYDNSDDSLIISGRHYGTAKISYPSGELQWILTPITSPEEDGDAYLLPLDEDFKQPSTQHSPEILPDFDKNPDTIDLLLYDNNSYITTDYDYKGANEYSQIVHYRINEKEMTIEEIWSFGKALGSRYFTIMVGDADYLSNGNMLGTFGFRDNILGSAPNFENTGTVLEVNPETDEILFVLDVLFDNSSDLYRSERMPLYPDTWNFALRETKAVLMAENQQDTYQEEVQILPTGELPSRYWSEDHYGYVDTVFDEHYENVLVTGFAFFDHVPSSDYETYLLLQGDNQSYLIPLELEYNEPFHNYLNYTYDIEEDLRTVRFSLKLPYAQLYHIVLEGDYQLGVYLHSQEASAVHDLHSICTVTKPNSNLAEAGLLTQQADIAKALLSDFQSNGYTLEEPMIQLDPFQTSPLTALVAFETEESGTMEVTVHGKDEASTIRHKFSALTSTHFLPIYGLYPNTENRVTLRFINEAGESVYEDITIETQALPSNMQKAELVSAEPLAMADGLTFISSYYFTAYDHNGDVRWYLESGLVMSGTSDIHVLENGNLITMADKLYHTPYYGTSLYEIDFMGQIYQEYIVNGVHHEVQELSNGNLIIASEKDFATTEDYILLMDRETGEILQEWDLKEVLWELPQIADSTYHDARKLDQLLFNPDTSPELLESTAMEVSLNDWFHNNSVYYDETRKTLLVSGRSKDFVMEFDANTLEILWILSDPSAEWAEIYEDKLLTAIGEDFQYSYGQHSAIILENGNLCLFDNGNFRSKDLETSLSASENYSRIVEYAIDRDRMTVEQVFSYGKEEGSKSYSTYLGSVQEIEPEHYLVNFGGIVTDASGNPLNTPQALYTDPSHRGLTRVVELVEGEEVYDLWLYGIYIANSYRASRLPLYTENSHYVNLSLQAEAIGNSKETGYTELNLPRESEEIDYVVNVAEDYGDRIALNIDYHNFSTGDKYLVLEHKNDVRCYPMTTGQTLYVNKAGLKEGDYSLGTMVIDPQGESYYSSIGKVLTLNKDVPSFVPLSVQEQLKTGLFSSDVDPDLSAMFVVAVAGFPLYYLLLQNRSDRPFALRSSEDIG